MPSFFSFIFCALRACVQVCVRDKTCQKNGHDIKASHIKLKQAGNPSCNREPVAPASSRLLLLHFSTRAPSRCRSLVSRANDWLRKNAEVRITTCETMTWMATKPEALDDSEAVVLAKSVAENTNTYYRRGLRSVRGGGGEERSPRVNSTAFANLSAQRDLVTRTFFK